jgi:hypothetical protein
MNTDVRPTNQDFVLAETKRHKPCLIYRGHRYVQDKIQNRTIYWRCEDRSHCNGRAHQLLVDQSFPILTIQHNHPPVVDDLSQHDIIIVDSHRRQRRRRKQQLLPRTNHPLSLTDSNGQGKHNARLVFIVVLTLSNKDNRQDNVKIKSIER